MADDLVFSCDCGKLTGELRQVGPQEGDRYICYCSDCRDLIRLLGKDDTALDKWGGTDLYQTRCAKMRITSGKEHLCAVHMTEKLTTRWYAGCCNTPLFNTLSNGKLPFITTILYACDSERRDAVLGPVKGHLFTEEATGEVGNVPKPSTFTMMWRVLTRALRDRLSGDFRRTALFDAKTLEPVAAPRHLTDAERHTLGRG